ncbi:MAG: deoxyguanosinetriphosphate triphosphohydrolase [Planctomycetes bacterium]|nr:deoxyguanosinetriphosphate triphosphohydrolase [Planctomycetota bacterium]
MITRQELEAREEKTLATYAAKSGRHRGRRYPEAEHPYRTAFQRDRDRVIHSTAFRRLEYKTQVFVNHEGDYYRTRLTHSMEAAQIARTLARALAMNEDLCEVLALAHDLGHPPFGHSGQDALQECMKSAGGFEHNLQGLRVVELLERRYAAFPGLNLTWETRESMRKHTVHPHLPVEPEYEPDWAPLMETTVVDISDSIAYDAHDLDDGLKAGLISEAPLRSLELWRLAADGLPADMDPELRQRTIVRRIIDLEVTDLVVTTLRRVERLNIRGLEDVRRSPERPMAFSDDMDRRKRELQRFLRDEVYRHHRVVVMSEKAKRFVTALFEAYTSNSDQLPPRFRAWAASVGVERAVADYIAGMTDRYAQDEYRRLFHPFENLL